MSDSSERQIEAAEHAVARETEATIAGIRGSLGCLKSDEFCADCGEPIGAARRAALPSATRCIGCQRLFEGDHRV